MQNIIFILGLIFFWVESGYGKSRLEKLLELTYEEQAKKYFEEVRKTGKVPDWIPSVKPDGILSWPAKAK